MRRLEKDFVTRTHARHTVYFVLPASAMDVLKSALMAAESLVVSTTTVTVKGLDMNATPGTGLARKALSSIAIAAVAATCMVSGGVTSSAATTQRGDVSSATKEWKARSADSVVSATKEWKAYTASPPSTKEW